MNRFKSLILILFALSLSHSGNVQAQFEQFGLDGRSVFDLRLYGGKVYAATSDGAYVRNLGGSDRGWEAIGLQGQRVRSIYPHSFGPLGYAVTVGLERLPGDTSVPVIYCTENSDTSWFASDDGISKGDVRSIWTLDGFPSPMICGETFAGSEGKLFRRPLTGPYEKVLDIGIGVTNVVRTDSRTRRVWVGGETGIFAPYIFLSEDLGSTWHQVHPFLGGDNACNSIVADESDTSIVYAGMEGAVMKSIDGGRSWNLTSLNNTRFYIYGLESLPGGKLYAVGLATVGSPAFALFESVDAGKTWRETPATESWKGFLCVVDVPTALPEESWLLIGTAGDGVLRKRVSTTSSNQPSVPHSHYVTTYPNPATDVVILSFSAPLHESAQVRVTDVTGRVVFDRTIDKSKHQVELQTSVLPSGIYYYQIRLTTTSLYGSFNISR